MESERLTPIDFARVRGFALGAPSPENVAALTILSSSDTTTELSLQQHLDIAPDLVAYNHDLPAEGDTEPLMMAQPVPHHATDKKRVKVYELRNNDWFDRGTGFCMANLVQNAEGRKEPKVIVESEDQPERLLLETKIHKEDMFQKQQETLIVWTEPVNGIDMALSFQESEGCSAIWRFVSNVQHALQNNLGGVDDTLSEDLAMDGPPTINLPAAELGNLSDIETSMRIMGSTVNGREALTKTIMAEDYIGKLIPLVEMAEDLESLQDLHRLCNIMKSIILLNDTSIIEHAVSDECVLGVVGALEYDPDFPSHKANHRHWLDNKGRYKEVVPIEDEGTRRKIHQTYRLQYLKDVVLARILDDPTFSVLNSLIFFNQVDIVQHLQGNAQFLKDLFGIFADPDTDASSKKEAVLFIQQCCAIAKNIQPPSRQNLYNNFVSHGLLQVIIYGLKHSDVAARVGATDILISIIDHDPQMIRQTIYRQMNENQPPLTDSLIELLLVEVDLGVKSQISEAIKVLLDQGMMMQQQMPEKFQQAAANGDFHGRPRPQADPQQELFLQQFYERSAAKLFKPLTDLENRSDMHFSVQQASMFSYLVEILCFFIRQHHALSRYFVMNNDIVARVAQLLQSPEKFLQLVAIRFFRALIGMQEEFFINHLTDKRIFDPVLQVVSKAISRDNLLSSASLEMFEFIKKENIKNLVKHLVENHREQLLNLSYLQTFRELLQRYDHTQGYTINMELFLETDDESGRRQAPNSRMMEHITMDPAEEEYWNTSDPEDEDEGPERIGQKTLGSNGPMTPTKPLVDYPSDEEGDENADPNARQPGDLSPSSESSDSSASAGGPPERIAEKRRREEDEEDEIDKLMQNKRRNSTSSSGSSATVSASMGRRRKSFSPSSGNGAPKKIAISLSPTLKSGAGDARTDGDA
ncbi:uncharacterized protein J7T54_006849 [Emericellopsis cladophorae]|uniref:Serine/threonine-protein phosphatase 4 regulatory subunit 3-like central domain-containing protein n=1 Tax=Emericellopsis cladophorae TaxID=2686198 RepID=A0A9Q0BGN7_9HYPO|nr:uncharacterized protein J7T54_006849 [Emericellopsis cladophorae]KAI6785207.1 hypothetical protein J7T54_006849 [Emericellopsis cladophorae]